MTTATTSGASAGANGQAASMESLLASVLSKNASAPNPPTSGPGGGSMDDEAPVTTGARSAEDDAYNKEVFGQTGAANAGPPSSAKGEPAQPNEAAKIAPTGEDSENESVSNQEVPNDVEPGTSSNAKLSSQSEAIQKFAAWRQEVSKLAGDIIPGNPAAPAAAEAKETPEPADKTAGQATDTEESVLSTMFGGDQQKIAAARQHLASRIAAASYHGRQLGRKTAAYLTELRNKAAEDEGGEEPPKKEDKEPSGESDGGGESRDSGGGSEGGASPVAAAEPSGPPPAAPAPAPPGGEAMGLGDGGGDPMMGGGGGDVTMEALAELAEEMGMTPEQLQAALMAATMGEGGGGGMEMPAQESSPIPAEKLAHDKRAAVKGQIKKAAREIVTEVIRRGRK